MAAVLPPSQASPWARPAAAAGSGPPAVASSALTPLAVFAVAPIALGGLRLRARAGPTRDAWIASLRAALPEGMPWQRLPLHASDDVLQGGLDLAATLARGRPVHEPGLLARSAGGVLVAAMSERLSADRAARLGAALDLGPPLAVLAIDEGMDDDEQPPAALLDRLALHTDDRQPELAVPADVLNAARARWPAVDVPDDLLEALVAAAQALGVHSARAAWQALCVTRVAAALRGRAQAASDDAALATQLVLAPRATRAPEAGPGPAEDDVPPEGSEADDPDVTADASQDPPAPAEAPPAVAEAAPEPPAEAPDTPEEAGTGALDERLVQAALAAMPAGLLARLAAGATRQRAGAAGRSGQSARSALQGRVTGSAPGDPRRGARLALLDTLRAAAPWQRLRQRPDVAHGQPDPGPRLRVTRDDLRIVRRLQRRTTTTIFAIDASGSQALHRLAEAKGAVERLLSDCYARRDRVAVVGFRGTTAQVLLAPTRSLVRARRELAGLPGGGGTPLAAGLDVACQLAQGTLRAGATPLVVLLTDGRANIARDGTPGRARATEDALQSARALRALGVATLLIDTSPRSSPAAVDLAAAAAARCLFLPHADALHLSEAVRQQRGSERPGAARHRD